MKNRSRTTPRKKIPYLCFILVLFLFFNCSFSFGSLDVYIQDQTTFTGDLFFGEELSLEANLSIATTEDSYTFVYDNIVVPFTTGQYVYLADNSTGRVFGGRVTNVLGSIIRMDTPINGVYNPNSTLIIQQNIDMNVDGSTTPRIFSIANPLSVPITLDITRVLFQMQCDSAPEFGEFCDIPGGLDNGLVMRTANGVKSNLFNVKTNGELVNLMYDVTVYTPNTFFFGSYGIGGRLTYAGPSKHGAVIRLEQGERLDIIIQDDLTDLESFRWMASFHLVDEIERDSVFVEDIKMLGIVFLIIAIGACFGYLGVVFINNKNKEYKVQYQLIGALFWCAVILVGWILTFIVMLAAEGQNYYEVIRVFFYIYSVIAGLTAGAGFIVISMTLTVIMFIKLFGGKK